MMPTTKHSFFMASVVVQLILCAALLQCLASGRFTTWHGYNTSLLLQKSPPSPSCKSFHEATRPYPAEFYHKLSLWSEVLPSKPIHHGETLYGSQEALQRIHDNQNPVDCKAAKYVVFGGWAGGFGSRIHFEGMALAVAMELGRVYLPHPDGDNYFWETSIPFCRDRKEPGFHCFYLPVSSKCTYADALVDVGGDVNKLRTYNFQDMNRVIADHNAEPSKQMSDRGFNLVVGRTNSEAEKAMIMVPSMFTSLLQCSPLRSDAHVYWWRAVSATYLLRPNEPTKQWLATLSSNASTNSLGLDLSSEAASRHFEGNSIGLQVRHGDKMKEMKLLPWGKYAEAVDFLVNRSVISVPNTHGAVPNNGSVYLITEDDKVVAAADQWGHENGWTIIHSTFFNRSAMSMNLPHRDQKVLRVMVHDDLEYISMLHNLLYALRCHYFVCTLASNSCRLIDELRCTIGAKCNRFYADLSRESCYEQPCVDGHGYIFNFQN